MFSKRRIVLAVGAVGVLATALLFTWWQGTDVVPQMDTQVRSDASPSAPSTATSETLIAEALKAGSISYEESLLNRAYAIVDDPRLDPAFRSPVIDWAAWAPLLAEINAKEKTLSQSLLQDLQPFRVRPNDPASIFNRSKADVVRVQLQPSLEWEGALVSGTRVRLWNKGPLANRAHYDAMIRRVWNVMESFFPHPLPDSGTPRSNVNPDAAVDVYLVDAQSVDPRTPRCQQVPINPDHVEECTLGDPTDRGAAPHDYVIVKTQLSDDAFIDTVAHELSHVRQLQYDAAEPLWLRENTATWVGYKVMKALRLVPNWEYDWVKYQTKPPDLRELFNTLDLPLDQEGKKYAAWLFFYYASMEKGDDVVKNIWELAATRPGADGIRAVNAIVPFDLHFPAFALRNWNQETVPRKYETRDDTFRPNVTPRDILERPLKAPGNVEIEGAIPHLAAAYYRFTFDNVIRKVAFQSLGHSIPQGQPRPHVWALAKIKQDWKDPEDWTNATQRTFCRDLDDENVTELILIVSNSDLDQQLVRQPKLRVIGEDVGCAYLDGRAKSTLRLKDDTQDVTYVSSDVSLRFRPRDEQPELTPDQPEGTGNTEYDLMPTAITWTVSGTKHGCAVDGRTIVNIPRYLNQPLDPTRLAYGYLNVVSPRNGDYHSVQVRAMDPRDLVTVTCPGNPPTVTKEPFRADYLLNILQQTNTHEPGGVVFKGPQDFDPDRIPVPSFALELPGVKEMLASRRTGRMVYRFEWELRPSAGAPGP